MGNFVKFALKEVLMKPECILLQVALLMGGLAAQNVGIGTSTPTERLHVAGNLRLDNAFMPGNQAGAVGNILLSRGADMAPVWLPNGAVGNILLSQGDDVAPVWLANGPAGSILTSMGPGSNPVWATTFCTSPAENRFIKFTSTSPTTACNTTLAENTNGNIWNADGAAAPVSGSDKFAIIATTDMPNAISGYATSGYGVYGRATAAAGRGVVGENTDPNGTAGRFVNLAAAGDGYARGVIGLTSQANGFGVVGFNLNTQDNTNPAGVFGGGGSTIGLYPAFGGGTGGAFTGRGIGVAGYKIGVLEDGRGGGYFTGDATDNGNGNYTPTHYAYVAWRIGTTNYKINGTGNVSTIVDGLNGRQDRRNMFAPEMPEIHFMDVGQGQLQGGRAYIQLDPIFAKNIVVNEQHPLRVLIQLEDECNGVRVTNKSQHGFEVIELNGGTSNARFTYFVIANRADEKDEYGNVISKHEGVRLPPAPGPLPAIADTIDDK
jgi:hypothetical protein